MKTSIIICTYNKEKTIFEVVAASCKHNPEAEVIVVDDGSTDNTEEVLVTLAFHHDFVYLKLPQNHGKNYAMAYGVEYASNEIILFIDADVKRFRKEHFDVLLKPIESGSVDMVVGAPSGLTIDFGLKPYKSVIGQTAVLKSDLMPILKDIREIRYGVESYLTLYYQTNGKRVRMVMLDGLEMNPFNTNAENGSDDKALTDPEIANSLLTNIDLITKRIQNKIQKTQNYTQSTISSVQFELNEKMKRLMDRISQKEIA